MLNVRHVSCYIGGIMLLPLLANVRWKICFQLDRAISQSDKASLAQTCLSHLK